MSYGVESIQIHKKLRLDKRAGSDNWYARLTLPNGKRLVKTTKTLDLETAREAALRLYYEVDARIQNKRTAIARDGVVDFLWRQAQLNSRIRAVDFDELIAAKSDERVFITRLSAPVTVHNLNRAFNALLDELDLKTGADGRTRTLYSWRHFYVTQDLERGVSTHALSRQLGNSTEMIDRHYSKYSPLLNAELHSGRKK